MEYPNCQEFTPLPDEYPPSIELGGTSIHTEDSLTGRRHQSMLKRMMQMMTVFTVVTYTAVVVAKEETIAQPEGNRAVIAVQHGAEDIFTGELPDENTQTTETMPPEEALEDREEEVPTEPVPEELTGTNPKAEPEAEVESEPETEQEEGQLCSTCGGTGDCGECKGDGYLGPGHAVSCPRCHGAGKEICPYCDAAGNSTVHDGTCDFPPCMGSHTYACTICGGGSTAVTCKSCGGSGNCQTCSGTG